ncbi:MAG: energy transducer TonB [Tannerella sp.]|jgi:protein TonB|nr:energy transducer TonB [Tannerella sp.]
MAKDINLTSQKWNDIIFEGKNKDYGAYELRMSSSKRMAIAFLISVAIVVFVAFLPSLIDTVKPKKSASDNLSESTVLADLQKELEEQVQEKDIIREEAAPPPPPLKSTIQFTAPEIVDASEIKEEEEIKSQEELAESKVQISVATVEGTDDAHGIDIADLEQHKVIAEDAENKIFDLVEQQPEFPGGVDALMKFIRDNINYPTIAAENGIKGRVSLKFVVTKTGEIADVKVIRGVDPNLDKEAIRVLKSMPKWIPGKQNGKTVNVYFSLPVNFVLQQ